MYEFFVRRDEKKVAVVERWRLACRFDCITLIGQRREVLSVALRLEKVKLGVDIALPLDALYTHYKLREVLDKFKFFSSRYKRTIYKVRSGCQSSILFQS